jgi:hypothetical protein
MSHKFNLVLLSISRLLVAKKIKNPEVKNYSFRTSMVIGIPYLLFKLNPKKDETSK